jgi:eukaryotic-like serine/threonine-protein kinase
MTQLGKYDILEELGRGGFGVVYKARDFSLERLVALKVLHPQLTVNAQFLARFRKEAQTLARINHPNVVTIHEIGEAEGKVYIAMEYLSGGSLADCLKDGSLSLEKAMKITREVGAGLHAGHEEGMIHRDVKPGNILFNKRGEAVIADFGLAKAMQVSSTTVASSFGGAVGTPYYRPPELWNGAPPPSPATDVYSLACVFYEMVTGQILFDGETPMTVLTKHASGPDFSSGPKLPAIFLAALKGALAKDPTNRPQGMRAFIAGLEKTQEKRSAKKPEPEQRPDPTAGEVASQDRQAAKPARKEQSRVASGKREKSGLLKWVPWAGLAVGLICIGAIVTVAIIIGALRDDPDQHEKAETEEAIRAAETPSPDVDSTKVNPVDGSVMVYVPAGEFLMGSENADADDDEAPEHTVYLDAYWLYKHEVTNAQYADFLNEESNQTEGGVTWLDGDDEDVRIQQTGGAWVPGEGYGHHPVVEVSWYGAQAYCEWAGGTLPTEAEWEKAAQGPDGRTYPWGSEAVSGKRANYCDENCELDWRDVNQDDGYAMTAPVGSFPEGASPYGALDMAGNVWEWVADWYDERYYTRSPDENPTGPASGEFRVLRGGSWGYNVRFLRSSFRFRGFPGLTLNYIGFRCLLSPDL